MVGKFFSAFFMIGFAFSTNVGAADFSGKYKGEKLSVEIAADGSAYSGQIHMGQQQFPLKAHEQGDHLAGVFTSQGNDFDFTASKQGDDLNLITGGTAYALKKISSPANPLAGAQPANPLTQQTSGDGPAGYTVVTSTDSGEALSAQKPDAQTVRAAFESTFPDLAKYFDGKPTISGAFEDPKDKSGLASFTASHKGQPVKGVVTCKLGEKGAAVAVIYCKADAPASEWNKLTAAPSDTTTDASGVKIQVYQFPDGTGSIGLADGWKTNAQTCMNTVQIQGPEDQSVNIGIHVPVQTPESPFVQMIKQNQASARRMNMRPPPPPPFIVSEFLEPGDALKTLMPQLSAMSVRNGGPSVTVDKIISQEQAKENIPNGKAANICYEVTRTLNGKSEQRRNLEYIESASTGPTSWMIFSTGISAPTAIFDRDQPVMTAMLTSLKENADVIQQKSQQIMDAQNRQAQQNLANSNQRFQDSQNQLAAAHQQAHQEQMAGYAKHNEAWKQGEIAKGRSNADFVESIRGYRTVLDTQTGEKSSVDYNNVNEIVNQANEQDPGRYVQIPLRDEMYPQDK